MKPTTAASPGEEAMNDNGLAALAAALHGGKIGCDFVQVTTEGTAHWVERSCTPKDHDEAAAAILAALPPDWCGHENMVDEGWLSEDNARVIEELRADLARLRRTEEAAREGRDRIGEAMTDPRTTAIDHLVWPEGPFCDENCPGEWSQWHDGYAWGTEKAEARLRRIVEAAREVDEAFDGPSPTQRQIEAIDDLRAALEEKP